MSAFGLAKQLGIERGQAQAYVDRYFERYPGVRRYMDETRASARRSGFVSTVFGRRLYLPEINARNNQLRQYAERSAINAPMQGTAADIIKRAMIGVAAWLAAEEPRARLIMQVHDELVVEVPEERADRRRRRHSSHHGRSGGAPRAAARRSGSRRQLGRGPLDEGPGTFVKRRGTNPSAPRKGAPAILPNAGSLIPAHPAGVAAPGASPESRTRGFLFLRARKPGLDPGLRLVDAVARQRREPRELDAGPERRARARAPARSPPRGSACRPSSAARRPAARAARASAAAARRAASCRGGCPSSRRAPQATLGSRDRSRATFASALGSRAQRARIRSRASRRAGDPRRTRKNSRAACGPASC